MAAKRKHDGSISSVSKRRQTRSPSLVQCSSSRQKSSQQTLTQLQFLPSPISPISDSGPKENSPMPPPTSKRRSRRNARRPAPVKNRTSTITQMDFLTSSLEPEVDEKDLEPIEASSSTEAGKLLISPPDEGVANTRQGKYTASPTTSKRRKKTRTKAIVSRQPKKAPRNPVHKGLLPAPPGHVLSNIENDFAADESMPSSIPESDTEERSSYHVHDTLQASRSISRPELDNRLDSSQSYVLGPPQTPVTKRKQVIPSSQSPDSLPPSTQREKRELGSPQILRSPLKGRDKNIMTPSKLGRAGSTLISGIKQVCGPVNSKIVVLPVALTSQGAVSRGAILAKSQRLYSENSPPPTYSPQLRRSSNFIPCSEDESDEDDIDYYMDGNETQMSASESLPSLSQLLGRSTMGRSVGQSQNIVRVGTVVSPKSHPGGVSSSLQATTGTASKPMLRRESSMGVEDETAFSCGDIIRTSSSGSEHHNENIRGEAPTPPLPSHLGNILNRSLIRSDSEAAAAQLQSDMLFHSTQATNDVTLPENSDLASIRQSQISTQGPTQLNAEPAMMSGNAAQSSPERIHVKLKSSSSIPIPMDDIPMYFPSKNLIQEAEVAEESGLMDSDDLNEPTYPRRRVTFLDDNDIIELPVEEEDDSHHAADEVPTQLISVSPSRRFNSSKAVRPQLEVQSSTQSDFSNFTPPGADHVEAREASKSIPKEGVRVIDTPCDHLDAPSSQVPVEQRYPFSSSPITKGAIWQVPDSLLESLPGPPGWKGYAAVDEDEMRRI